MSNRTNPWMLRMYGFDCVSGCSPEALMLFHNWDPADDDDA